MMFRRAVATMACLLFAWGASATDRGYAESPVSESPVSESPMSESPMSETSSVSSDIVEKVRQGIRDDLRFLSSDELKGRGTDSDSIDRAADYIARRMRSIGLRTDAVDGSAFQMVDVPLGSKAGSVEDNMFTAVVDGEVVRAKLNESFMPLSIGASDAEATGGLVFAGYGITAPEYDYDDYENIDATGSIVIVLRKEPGSADRNDFFDGRRATRHALFTTKITNAIEHGAVGVLIVNDRQSTSAMVRRAEDRLQLERRNADQLRERLETLGKNLPRIRKSFEQQLTQTESSIPRLQSALQSARRGVLPLGGAGRAEGEKPQIPVASIGRNILDRLLEISAGPSNLESTEAVEQAIDRDSKTRSRVILAADDAAADDAAATMKVSITPSSRTSPNVIGVIDPKGDEDWTKQTIVVGAHYDHVGMGGQGSLAPGTIAVHNGADDNASGTTALLAVAELVRDRLQTMPSHRRIVWMTFTGEERGLIGSKHYVDNPLFALDRTAAMVNMDMVGRLRDNELTVYGTGSGDKIDAVIESANQKEAARSRAFDLVKVATGYGPSDHQSFFVAGVPVVFFFTGLHDDYHRPSDDFDKINYDGMNRITDTVCDVVMDLATDPVRSKYSATERRGTIRR